MQYYVHELLHPLHSVVSLRSLSHFLSGSLISLCVVSGHGATLKVDSKTIPGLTPKSSIVSHTVRLSGPIEEGDADRLRAVLVRLKAASPLLVDGPLATIELSSLGGDLYEGLKIGYLLREYSVASVVRAKDICLSACALAFLGGTRSRAGPAFVPSRGIEIGGQVGFHNFVLNANSDQLPPARAGREGLAAGFGLARGGAAALVRYASTMGIDTAFIARLLGSSPEQWDYVDVAQTFITLQTCPIGLGRIRESPAVTATNICNNATAGLNPASPSQARPVTPREGKRQLLEQVQRNIEAFSVKGPLVAQLKAVLATRDDQLVDAVYNDLRSAGIPLPELHGALFLVTGYAAGEFNLACYVSFSRDNPDRFDIVLQGAEGTLKPLQSPPPACPGVFLYDKDDMLNPRR
ncbi:MAG: hypothetical protein K2X72_36310 [Reyranella sp.]|nr:hypothetical protein [Reyranella sp.]